MIETAPQHVVLAPTARGLTVSWDAVGGASTYHVYLAASPSVSPTNYLTLPEGRHVPGVPRTTCDLAGLSDGGTYWVIVAVENSVGLGTPSAPVSTTLAPGAVASVFVQPGNGRLEIGWINPIGATGFDVYLAKDSALSSANWASLLEGQRFPSVQSPFTVPGLENGADYYAIVVARNATGTAPDSIRTLGTPTGRGSFVAAGFAAADAGAQSGVLADFDGDGVLDLAVANRTAGTVCLGLGLGDGTFAPPSPCAAGNLPFALVAGDFDADGRLDLAVANEGSSDVSILLGDGSGGLALLGSWPVGAGPVAIAAAATRGLGWPLDLVTADRDGSTTSVLLGNGDGTFAAATSYACGLSPLDVVVADFDADGALDLVTSDSLSGTVSFLKGDGFGGFAPAVSSPAGAAPSDLAVADFDSDGLLDLVVSSATANSVSPLHGVGDGTFAPYLPIVTSGVPESAVVGDFDGDGKLDLAFATDDGMITVVRGDGVGSFSAMSTTIANVGSVTVGDINGDGALDVVVTDDVAGNVQIFLGQTI